MLGFFLVIEFKIFINYSIWVLFKLYENIIIF